MRVKDAQHALSYPKWDTSPTRVVQVLPTVATIVETRHTSQSLRGYQEQTPSFQNHIPYKATFDATCTPQLLPKDLFI